MYSGKEDSGIDSASYVTYNGNAAELEMDNTLYIRVSLPDHSVQKVLQFNPEESVWLAKQKVLATLGRDLRDGLNYGMYCPPTNGKAGKFLDEERLLKEYPLPGPIGFLEFKYKRRVYKLMQINQRKIKQLHSKANLKQFIEHVKHNNVEKINKLLNKGLDPNYHEHETGETPLTLAVCLNRPRSVIMALFGGGTHLDFRTKRGITAMHKAAMKGNLESVRILLELGASPNYKDSRFLTPLYYCVMNDVNPACVQLLLHDHARLGTKDEQGWSEVHVACKFGRHQHLEHLLFYGADLNAQNSSGNTPLHVCAVNNQENCARILLFRGADKNIANFANQTSFDVAIMAANYELAEVINSFKEEEVVPFREAPAYNIRRRPSMSSERFMTNITRSRSEVRLNSLGLEGSTSPSSQRSMSPSHMSDNLSRMSTASSYGPESPKSLTASNRSMSMSVLSVGEDNYWEGRTDRGEGWFPSNSIQEVKMRRKPGCTRSHSVTNDDDVVVMRRKTFTELMQSDGDIGQRTVVLHKGPGGGFGFVLRGARSRDAQGSLDFEPSEEFPALQYLERVDPGSIAEKVGLKAGDFILEINGNDVIRATHEMTVHLIKESTETLAMKVIRVHPSQRPVWKMEVDTSNYMSGSMTLPHKKKISKAPAPPRRDPRTSLSVGKARSKSMMEGTDISYSEIEQLDRTLAEFDTDSLNDGSVGSTPRENGEQQKIASIRSRPRSARINATELEEIFGREASAGIPVAVENEDKPKVPMPKTYANPAELKRKMNQRKEFNRTKSMGDISATKGGVPMEQESALPQRQSGIMTTSRMEISPYAESVYANSHVASNSTWHAVNSTPNLQTHVRNMEQLMRENGTHRPVYDSTRNNAPAPPSWKPPPPAQVPPPPSHAPPKTPNVPSEIVKINTAASKSQPNTPRNDRHEITSQDKNVTFADDKVFENAAQFMQRHPNANMIVTADVHNKDKYGISNRQPFIPEPDYDTEVDLHQRQNVEKMFAGNRDYSRNWSAPQLQQQQKQNQAEIQSQQTQHVQAQIPHQQNTVKQTQRQSPLLAPPVMDKPAKQVTPPPASKAANTPAPPPPPAVQDAPPTPPIDSGFAAAIHKAAANRDKRASVTEVKKAPIKKQTSRIQESDLQAAVAKRQARVSGAEQTDALQSIEQRIEENKKKNQSEDPQAALKAAVARRRQKLQGNNMDNYVDNIEKKISQTKKLQVVNGKVIENKKIDSSSTSQLKQTNANPPSKTIMSISAETTTDLRSSKPEPAKVSDVAKTIEKESLARTVSAVSNSSDKSSGSQQSGEETPGGSLLAQAEKLRQKFLSRKQSGGQDGDDNALTKSDSSSKSSEKEQNISKQAPMEVKVKPTSPPKSIQKKTSTTGVTIAKVGDKGLFITASEPSVQKKNENVNFNNKNPVLNRAKMFENKNNNIEKSSYAYTDTVPPPLISQNGEQVKNGKENITSEWVSKIPLRNGDSNDSSADSVFSSNEGDSLPMTEIVVIPPPPSFNSRDRNEDTVSLVSSVSTLSTLSSERDYMPYDSPRAPHLAHYVIDQPSIPEVPEMSSTPPPPPEFGDLTQGSSGDTMRTLSRRDSASSLGSSASSMTTSSGPKTLSNNYPFESKPIEVWSADDVCDWLECLQLHDYKDSFTENAIDGPSLAMLSKDEFKELGVSRIGHRMTMERSIKKVKAHSNVPQSV